VKIIGPAASAGATTALGYGQDERRVFGAGTPRFFPILSMQLTLIGDYAESIDLTRASGRRRCRRGAACEVGSAGDASPEQAKTARREISDNKFIGRMAKRVLDQL
jgi:hypothetical protein